MRDVVVLGAGPAGCAAAIALAEAGRSVLVVEREREPRETVCGEFLGADAVALLARLGVAPRDLGAEPIARFRVGSGRHEAGGALPFAAQGLPRRLLDAALRRRAREAGAEFLHAAVRGLPRLPAGWGLEGPGLAARRVVLATGKHGLRDHPRGSAGGPGAVGLKLHLDGVPLGGEVILLPFAGGYAGLQPTAEGRANLCAALSPGEAVPRGPEALLDRVRSGSDLAARLLRDARPAWEKPLAVAGVPYGWSAGEGEPGLYRVGDQASVIPSFTGDGMAMALASGLMAAEAIRAGVDGPGFQRGWARRSARQMRLAGAGAWMLRNLPRGFARLAGGPLAPMLARATRVA